MSQTRLPDPRGPWIDACQGAGLVDPDGTVRPNIFAEMSAIAVATGSVNLGQGFPTYDGPREVLEAAAAAVLAGRNQYPPGRGVPELLNAIAEHHRTRYGLDYDTASEITVTAGATEALAGTLLGLVKTGDEVIVIEPYYDAYAADIARAGGVQVNVPLRWHHDEDGSRFALDLDVLRAAFTPRTRMVLINNPHNPTGVVLPDADLALVVELASAHNAIIVADEVYEHLVFEGTHRPIATFPGAKERTLLIGSGGKTFSATGWKIGWVCGPASLIDGVFGMKQWFSYVNGAPFQPAIAVGLGLGQPTFDAIAADLKRRRDMLCSALSDVGFDVAVPDAGYFVIADPRPLGFTDGEEFCRALPEKCGVVAIPVSAFCGPNRTDMKPLVRFAYCKDDETLNEAVKRLRTLAG